MKIFVQIILDQNNIDLNNLNIPYVDSQLPIIIHAAILNNKAIIEFLIKNGANINIQDNCSTTALMYVSFIGYTEIVKLLIENGADLNKQDRLGRTALLYASEKGHTEIVKLLRENLANNNNQQTSSYCTIL